MSIEALRWALEVGQELELEPTQRHILLILGNRADEAGGSLYPSVDWICQRTGFARRTVQLHLQAMEKARLLTRARRNNDNGDRTSDAFQLAMRQPGLPLGEGGAEFAPPRATMNTGGAQQMHPPGARGAPKKQEDTQEEKTTSGGGKAPTPVAAGFKAYSDGIQAKYGSPYPPSRRINGMLSNVVGRVGAEHIVPVVNAYLGSQDPWYAKVRHKPEFLVRDCEQLLMQIQAAGAGLAQVPTKAKVYLLAEDGTVKRDLGEVPAGNLEAIAKRARTEYASTIARMQPKYIGVRQGAERRQFSVEELR